MSSDVYRYSYIGYILSTRAWLQGLRTLPWWKAWPKRCRSLRECQLCPVNWHSNEHVGRTCRWFSLSIIPKNPEEYESYILNQFSKLLSLSCKQKLCHYISIRCRQGCRGRLCTYNCQCASTPSGFCPTFQLLLHLEKRYPRQKKILSMSTISSKFSMYKLNSMSILHAARCPKK